MQLKQYTLIFGEDDNKTNSFRPHEDADSTPEEQDIESDNGDLIDKDLDT